MTFNLLAGKSNECSDAKGNLLIFSIREDKKLKSKIKNYSFRATTPVILVFLFFALFASALNAQQAPAKDINYALFNGRIIKDIVLVGNKHTRPEVIRRELLFKSGQIFSDTLLQKSKRRLENLWLFNRVEFIPFATSNKGDSVSVIVAVTERWYFFPFPVFEVQDRDWNKLTYGFGFAHTNFHGRNEKLIGSLQFGNRPGTKFSYLNPWIGDDLHLFTGFYFCTFRLNNYSYDFPEKHIYSVFHFGKYWTRDFMTEVSFMRDQISVNAENAHYMATESKRDVNYGLTLSTLMDYRDLYAYPSKGWYLNFQISKMGLFEPKLDYMRYYLDFRKYINIKPFILAGRIFTIQTQGKLPVYDRVYIGYKERIRGHFNEVFTGNHAFILGGAIRLPLLPVRYFTFDSQILPDVFTTNLKFGINVGAFIESGQVTHTRKQFALRKMVTGFGAGLHFLLPYVEVLRLDLAFDEKMNHQFIAEILMPF